MWRPNSQIAVGYAYSRRNQHKMSPQHVSLRYSFPFLDNGVPHSCKNKNDIFAVLRSWSKKICYRPYDFSSVFFLFELMISILYKNCTSQKWVAELLYKKHVVRLKYWPENKK